jgi:hypothetical protein
VPAAFVAEAAFPLTIDPLLAARNIHPGILSGAVGSMDLARDDLNDQILAAYTEATSAVNYDVVARLFNDDLTGGVTVFSDLHVHSSPTVKVACAGFNQSWCIVFERLDPGVSSRVHVTTRVGGSTTFSSASFPLAVNGSFGENHWRPDVGGTVDGSAFLIVCQRELNGLIGGFTNTSSSRILAVVTMLQGTVLSTRVLAPHTTGADMERPAVNKRAAPATDVHWLVVWQEHDAAAATPEWAVAGRLLSETNVVSAGAFRHGGSPPQHRTWVPSSAASAAATSSPMRPGLPTRATSSRRRCTAGVSWPRASTGPIRPRARRPPPPPTSASCSTTRTTCSRSGSPATVTTTSTRGRTGPWRR